MSGQNININERRTGENKVSEEEIFKIPREGLEGKVVNANIRDDNEEMAKDIDEAIGYETFEDEARYESPSDEKIVDSKRFEDAKRLSEVIRRAKAQKIGLRVMSVYRKTA
ncbi:hypothetical protein IKG02_03495 [Candidatus Saccharibacteria bacterium]|nr:hypothetical protein [Candidatus Saccharibacteria bacterium]